MAVQRITVPLAERAYDVFVGHGAISELASILPDRARRLAIVTQRSLSESSPPVADVLERIEEVARARGISVHRCWVPEDEHGKTMATVEALCRSFAAHGLTRQDLVVSVGGGLVCDVTGFAAAVWHRGTPVVHVATTLLAMVDAAIGGKTAVNLPDGKNLVGAFWQPQGVVCDLDVLESLPERERRCGLGEIAKYHFLTGADLLALPLDERIAACAGIKAAIVAEDEREGGRRALLNYGHTLGHALETVGDHDLAHGEAVAIGLVFAAHLARALGRIDEARVAYHERVVGTEYGLRTRPPEGLDAGELLQVMSKDKKALDGLTFVLDSARGPEVVSDVEPRTVLAVLDSFLSGTNHGGQRDGRPVG
ncbi:MAG: 3-dehydroquinate synthase family protein [Actinomycetota bacterium]